MFSFPKWPSMGDQKTKAALPPVEPKVEPKPAEPSGPCITILVIGAKGVGPSERKVPFRPGLSLYQYLREQKLLALAMRSAVYDLSNTSRGRCRSYYIPQEGSVIRIGPAEIGIQGHLQQSSHSTKQEVNEISLDYQPAKQPKSKAFQDIEQI